jgi:anti-sigma regulatory factor (Ser/Thr protein kinase)
MSAAMSCIALARQKVMSISDASGVAEARRAIAQLGSTAQFDEATSGELALAVTEAGTNIFKHAREGNLVARILERGGSHGIEVIAIDKGPGIANIANSMRDGHSTAGSPGSGLGALQRRTSALQVWSRPGAGTIVRFEVWPKSAARSGAALASGVISKEKAGEPICGDGWSVSQGRGRLVVFVVDGLGHGPAAADASRAALETVKKNLDRDAPHIIDAVHGALRPTRGAAAAVALLQPESELCSFCGIGNIAASIRSGGASRSMVSHNGILGHSVRKVQEFQYPFPKGSLLVMHSDGIATRWDLAAYPGLEAQHPAMVSAALFRDHSRDRDDLTVLALRNEGRA